MRMRDSGAKRFAESSGNDSRIEIVRFLERVIHQLNERRRMDDRGGKRRGWLALREFEEGWGSSEVQRMDPKSVDPRKEIMRIGCRKAERLRRGSGRQFASDDEAGFAKL